jgi:hypothetical protein
LSPVSFLFWEYILFYWMKIRRVSLPYLSQVPVSETEGAMCMESKDNLKRIYGFMYCFKYLQCTESTTNIPRKKKTQLKSWDPEIRCLIILVRHKNFAWSLKQYAFMEIKAVHLIFCFCGRKHYT